MKKIWAITAVFWVVTVLCNASPTNMEPINPVQGDLQETSQFEGEPLGAKRQPRMDDKEEDPPKVKVQNEEPEGTVYTHKEFVLSDGTKFVVDFTGTSFTVQSIESGFKMTVIYQQGQPKYTFGPDYLIAKNGGILDGVRFAHKIIRMRTGRALIGERWTQTGLAFDGEYEGMKVHVQLPANANVKKAEGNKKKLKVRWDNDWRLRVFSAVQPDSTNGQNPKRPDGQKTSAGSHGKGKGMPSGVEQQSP